MNDVGHPNPGPPAEAIEPPLSKHEKRKFAVEIAGLLAVIVTIIITLLSNRSNGKDTANAIAQMKSIAETMRNEQNDIANQSAATVNMAEQTKALASETKKVADATQSQAETSALNARTAQHQLTATNKQLAQNIDLFAAAQRPIMDLDQMSEKNSFDRIDELGIFIWRYGFKNVGVGPASTFHYTDAMGRAYSDTACVWYDEFSDLRDCSQPDRPRGHASASHK